MPNVRRGAWVAVSGLLFGIILASSWLAGPPVAAAQINGVSEEKPTPTPVCEPPTETPTPQPGATEEPRPSETPPVEVTLAPTLEIETATPPASETPVPEVTATATDTETPTLEPVPSTTPEAPTATPTPWPFTETPTLTAERPTETSFPTATPSPTASAPPIPTPTLWLSTPSPTPTEAPKPPGEPNSPFGALVSTTLVIHQVYGGGGNSGAPYRNDFIEVRNLSALPANAAGWSVQYASATGGTWQVTPISGTVAPNGVLLIQLAGGANGAPLPPPDITGTVNLAATAGKVALVNTTAPLSGTCPLTLTVDFLGYGATANCAETAPLGNLSNTTAALRTGPIDTDNNVADFTIAAPSPRGLVAPTPTPTEPFTPTLQIIINEVAWGGTAASAADEWIELYNPNAFEVNLAGWRLASSDGSPSILLNGVIAAGGYFLLERTDDNTVSDLTADQIFTGDLGNAGETLTLRDGLGNVIDTANGDGGPWPAGSGAPGYFSMERTSVSPDTDDNWHNNNGLQRNGLDANGQPLNGTPRQPNSLPLPTATPTPTLAPFPPLAILINEVAWGGTAASAADEWIELYNPNPFAVNLAGWRLASSDGSPSILLNGVIAAGGYFLLERTDDSTVADIVADLIYTGDLSNAGETLTLRDGLGNVIDTANGDGGSWPAGSGAPDYFSMERTSVSPDTDDNWHNNNGLQRNGLDANGQPLNGTPRQPNSLPLPTATPTPTLAPFPPLAILINEVAWAGTAASAADEWIELYNPGTVAINLSLWTLTDGGDVNIVFPNGFVIAAGSYALLERTDDSTVSDIAADLIYTGGLNNAGETLTLRDGLGNVIDTANGDGGPWPAGDAGAYASMERIGVSADSASVWRTHSGAQFGRDAAGNRIRGTPKNLNSLYLPTPTPQPFPAGMLLNEFLPAPASGADEFIEIINTGTQAVDVSGWQVDDVEGGSAPRTLPPGTLLQPGEIRAFDYAGLNNDGDSVRLLYPDGRVADEFSYDDSDANVSFVRLPDGGPWSACGAPTPGQPNVAGLCGPSSGSTSRPQTENAVPIGVFRSWPAGAWATITGRVTAPAPLFGQRTIFIQDDTGGIAVYLGRGDWPKLEVGQTVSVFGYQRRRATGRIEMYARNLWHIAIAEPDGVSAAPRSGVRVNADTAGQLVTLTGRIVRLEGSAFWLDAGAGAVRVFFASTTGVRRPRVARGQLWTVTGIVTEMSATRTRAAGWQLQPRFANDARPASGATTLDPSATLEPTPTEEPTATPGP